MANGNNNSGEFFDSYGLRALFEKISQNLEGREETLASNAMSQQILKVFTDNVKDVNKLTEKEIEKVGKVFLTELRAMFGGSNDLTSYMKTMVELLKDMAREGNLTAVQGANRVNSTFANLVYASENTKRAGGDPIINRESKKAKGSQEAQEFYSTYLPEGVKQTNKTLENILSFFNAEKSGEKTKRRQFVEDLVDGLSRSKFFGGAIMDFVKLIIYMVGSWLKDKGPLGKALTVALVAGAPIIATAIATALIGGMAKLFTGLLTTFVLNPLKWLGGKLIAAIAARGIGSSLMNMLRGGNLRVGTLGGIATANKIVGLGSFGTTAATVGAIGATSVATGLGAKATTSTGSKLAAGFLGKRVAGIVGANALPGAGQIISIGLALWTIVDLIKMAIDWFKNKENKEKSGHWWDSITKSLPFTSGSNKSQVEYSSNKTINDSSGDHLITSQYGMRVHPVTGKRKRHTGVDLDYKLGEEVGAYAAGDVVFAGKKGGYGNAVVIRDKFGVEHLYGHLNNINKDIYGKRVEKGQVIGLAGQTGVATGPHLHYETRRNGTFINPIEYLNALNAPLDELDKKDKKDKFAQNVADYWNSRGKDKGFLHSKARDYAVLANEYKEEYLKNLGIDPFGYEGGINSLKYQEARAAALSSQESKDYVNKRIKEFVEGAKAISNVKSIRVNTRDDIEDMDSTTSVSRVAGDTEPFEQWQRIKDKNTPFKETTMSINPPKEQIKIDMTGTDTCSRILQNALNAQQQAFIQQH